VKLVKYLLNKLLKPRAKIPKKSSVRGSLPTAGRLFIHPERLLELTRKLEGANSITLSREDTLSERFIRQEEIERRITQGKFLEVTSEFGFSKEYLISKIAEKVALTPNNLREIYQLPGTNCETDLTAMVEDFTSNGGIEKIKAKHRGSEENKREGIADPDAETFVKKYCSPRSGSFVDLVNAAASKRVAALNR
jgi:hypothetical protein